MIQCTTATLHTTTTLHTYRKTCSKLTKSLPYFFPSILPLTSMSEQILRANRQGDVIVWWVLPFVAIISEADTLLHPKHDLVIVPYEKTASFSGKIRSLWTLLAFTWKWSEQIWVIFMLWVDFNFAWSFPNLYLHSHQSSVFIVQGPVLVHSFFYPTVIFIDLYRWLIDIHSLSYWMIIAS